MAAPINLPVNAPANIDTPSTGRYNLFLNSSDSDYLYKKDSAGVSTPVVAAGTGTVTSVSFTGGLISVATATTTPALTVAGTSGGIPYFSSGSTWATSAALAANSIVIGGGAGVAPSTITTGTGVVTALGVNVGSAGAFVVNGGALGTPSSGILTNCTGLVLTTGVTGVLPTANGGTGVNIASAALVLGTASAAAGQLTLSNATNAFTQTIRGTNPSASIIYDLPTTAPTLGQVLSATAPAAGVVTLSWATAASGITVGTTTITSGTSLRIPYNLAGVYQEQANFTMGSVASGYLDVPTGYAIAGSKLIYSPNSGSIVIGGSSVSVTGIESTILSRDFNVALTGRSNTFVGRLAYQNGGASGEHNVGVGMQSLMGVNGSYNVMVGSGLNSGAGGSISYYTGIGTGSNPVHSSTVGIGHFATNIGTTATHQGILGSKNANGYISDWYFNGVTHTSAYSVVLNACGGSGTNNAGANITIAAGKGTGTAASGNNVEQTSVKTTTGTTAQLLTDRHNIIGKYVDITGGVATTFGNLALGTSSTVSGGTVIYTIEANDATDYQSLSGVLKYDVVNKAGTLTVAFEDDQNSACACSAGTLTATVTATASGTNVLFQANAVSSLSETVLRVSFQVLNNFGQAIVTAA